MFRKGEGVTIETTVPIEAIENIGILRTIGELGVLGIIRGGQTLYIPLLRGDFFVDTIVAIEDPLYPPA